MHGLPSNEIANVIDRGYSAEAIEEARRLLIRTYYQAGFARDCGDCEHSSSMSKTTVYVNNHLIKWVVWCILIWLCLKRVHASSNMTMTAIQK